MKRRHVVTALGGAIASLSLGAGLKALRSTPANAQSATLLVSVAASVQDAVEAIDPLFEQVNPGVTVNYNFGSSGALQQQIEQGAPVDVFLSAANAQMNALQQGGLLLPNTRRNLLTNQLVLIVPDNSRLNLTGFRQLTRGDVRRIAVGEFRSVPAGQYAEQVFNNLGILGQLQPRLIFANNVRAVLAAVESGNVDAGIVYRTDALISDRVTQVATAPSHLHDPIVYPIAVIGRSRNSQVARTYVQFLRSRRARIVFERYGFGLAS